MASSDFMLFWQIMYVIRISFMHGSLYNESVLLTFT